LGLRGPVVSYDGALICAYPSGEHWHSDPLSAVIGQAAVDAIARHGLQPLAQYNQGSGERVLTGPESNDTALMGNYYDLYAAQFERHALAELCVGKGDPLRIVAFGPLEHLEPIAAELRPLPCQLYLNPRGSYGAAELSVMSLTTSKGNALSVLSSRLQLAPNQSMALGDSFNDLSMLRLAGLGVAMGQAPPEVQAVASAVTLPNTEDGAALAIERYLLDGKLPKA
ncbi:MAG: HAD hydrolase family protein, partial [Ktedonobacteraceae bacterium]